jgi:hypothetical protein
MAKPQINQANPLTKFMRQPKIYITLPSEGKYWAPNTINIPESGQLAVYSMTAKDELMMKTPDALLNGQSVVDVIHSCIPDIKSAWACPSIDLDMLLVAIRIATYGDKMTIGYKITEIDEDADYEIDLHTYIDQISQMQWREQIVMSDEMTIFVRPLTYKNMTSISQKSFETNKMLRIADDSSMTDQEKATLLNESFKTLTDLTTDMVSTSIFKIKLGEVDVTEARHIKEFIENADKSVVDAIQTHINELKVANDLKPAVLNTSEEQQSRGAPATIEVPISFDQSNFFA